VNFHQFAIMNEDQDFFLPINSEEFDLLVDELVTRYQLPNREHAVAIVSNRIQHLPPDQATSTLKYLGHCVLKNLAYQIANQQGNKVQHKMQVDELISRLKADHNDTEARDLLEKAVNVGSTYAKDQLALVDDSPVFPKVVEMKPAKIMVSGPGQEPA